MENLDLLNRRISSAHLPALDGLRFIAVFLVIFYHCGFEAVPGGHGVMLFFVLSGFLITWLMLKENEKTGTISLSGFFKRRVLRIFPAFYAYIAVTLILLWLSKRDIPWMHALSSVFYLSNYFSAFNPESNNAFSHTWSLAVEEQFYLFFPLFFLLFCRSLKRLTTAICAVIVAAWIWRAVLVFGFEVSGGYVYTSFETRIDQLLTGCVLAVVLHRKLLASIWKIAVLNSLMPVLTLSVLAVSVFVSYRSLEYKSVIGFAFEPVLMAILIVQMITFSGSGFWKLLEWEPVKYVGTFSYSLYLYQQLTTSIVPNRLAGVPFFIQLPVTIAVTIGVAMASFYLIETPFLDLKSMTLRDVISYNRLKLTAMFTRSNASNEALAEFLSRQKTSRSTDAVKTTLTEATGETNK